MSNVIEQIIEDSWNLGWIPSSSSQADFGAPSQGLLRMDNLTLDERGSLRLIDQPSIESNSLGFQTNSIAAAYINSRKLRYLYDNSGRLLRNYGAAVSISIYDLLIATGGTTLKAGFLNALGHVIAVAGTLQYKDRGDIQWPLQIPQPNAPVLTNQVASKVNLSNLDGGGNFTNWTSVATTAFANAGTNVNFTPPATNVAVVQTVFAALVDTTNFGSGTGSGSPNDPFLFSIAITDPTLLNYFKIELICTDPGAGPITDEFWIELDYANFSTNQDPNNPYIPSTLFTLTPGGTFQVNLARSDFQRTGFDPTLSMATIKAVRFTVGYFASATFTLSNLFCQSGAITGATGSTIEYVAVELNDTGQFVQYSVASAAISTDAAIAHIKVDRSGHACNAQCNNIRFYRNDTILGQFIEVNRQTGAYGFTPAFFIDSLSDEDAIAAAAIDTSKILNYFRAQLPTNIIGGIYFASRVIYLTTNSFFPSFQLDFGSYDSRFNYELVGTNTEICLFVTKLSVGTFIIATTVDFYQVTGDFSLVSTPNADGTTTVTQNVNILPLGIADPAINDSFFEIEGNIFYMSARGLRSMSNGVSTLLNTSTELLFRGEARYGFPYVSLQPNNLSLMGIVASGTRVYVALPFSNGANAVLVSTYNSPLPQELRGTNYWRPMLMAALCMAREQDGTTIYADQANFIGALENAFTGTLTVDFLTQYNFGQHPSQTKTVGGILIYINTGGNDLTLTINGLTESGAIVSYTRTINTATPTILSIDPHAALINCVAFQTQITGNTSTFELNYIILQIIQDYPPLTYYALVPFTNFDKTTAKQLAKWGFVVDPLGQNITVQAKSDNTDLGLQIITPDSSENIFTAWWKNLTNFIGTDWQLEVTSETGMHFFKFMPPDVIQEHPTVTYYQLVPFTNFGKDTLKKLSKWGFVIDTMGNPITVKVTADNVVTSVQMDTSLEPQGITTLFWYNIADLAALDWQIEITAPLGMRFYKFMSPDILQVYPPGRVFDQFGPLDLDRQGIVFMMRLRVINEGTALHYKLLDSDTVIYENDIATTAGNDTTYEEVFPKGINTSVFRILLSATTVFYKFSLELKVRTTGKETEERWIKV